MDEVLSTAVREYVESVGNESDPVLESMEAYADRRDFPTVGRPVGRLLHLLTGLADARRVFEFGSGFGYSAYWFARAVGSEGEVICTDRDAELLERAADFLREAGLASRVTLEHGDALEVAAATEGPFDVVLVDHEKRQYPDALELAVDRLAPGGLVVADNAMTAGILNFDGLSARLRGEAVEIDEQTAGVARYLETITDDPAFETVVVPVGEGVAVSRHRDGKG